MPLKRRSSLFVARNNSANANALERENSSNSTASSVSTAEPDTTIIPGADEDHERRQRQRLQKRNSFGVPGGGAPAGGPSGSSAGVATSSPAPDTPGGVSGYSAAQLAAHYNDCMKLSAENKISVKNAFQLKLIDYMDEMLKKKGGRRGAAGVAASAAGANPLDNFQASSCALDASTKIYAHRVDCVHNETMKLASGVGSNKEENAQGDGTAAEGGEEQGDDQDGATKKRLKRKKKSNSIEKNLANINLSKLELEFDIDPLFKKVSAQFDSGASGGQFLSTLQIKDDTSEMLLNSTARVELTPLTQDEVRIANITLLAEGPAIGRVFGFIPSRNKSLSFSALASA